MRHGVVGVGGERERWETVIMSAWKSGGRGGGKREEIVP